MRDLVLVAAENLFDGPEPRQLVCDCGQLQGLTRDDRFWVGSVVFRRLTVWECRKCQRRHRWAPREKADKGALDGS